MWLGILMAGWTAGGLCAQPALTWAEVRARFEAANPTLQAGGIAIQESKAQEITAHLRPNPTLTATLDQLDPFTPNPYRPLGNTLPLITFDYLHERQHKRELRLESAQRATMIAEWQQADVARNLIFNLRNAFVQTLQAKSVAALAKENLDYFDRELAISRDRFQAGDIARVDLDRLELQRVQYEADYQTAQVNLRTAKIALLTLLDDRRPVEQFDVTGVFDFAGRVLPLEELRATAMDARPDLKAAALAIEKAQTDRRLAAANSSADPTFGLDIGRNPPIPAYFGVSVNIPLRIFDRNQGEKLRTELEIKRTERLREVAAAQALSDVDSAYAVLTNTMALLQPYKTSYLPAATRVRDTMSFSYQHGQASLLEYLDAQRDYRSVELSYLILVGSYLASANQVNLAAGREVIQ
ncbi:MAG: TolC family protein [Acidobacteriia bacterium]|nr:TolC family protein [Terriglobia bacterium]